MQTWLHYFLLQQTALPTETVDKTPVNINENEVRSVIDQTKRSWMDFTQKRR